MTFSEWWDRVKKAFMKTANWVALTLLIVPSYLTSDKLLFAIGMVMELVYLLLAPLLPGYQTRAQSNKRRVEDPLDRWLLIVTVAGFVVIFFFGFGKHLFNHPWPYLTHAEGWEVGAITWTALFLVYYLFKFRVTTNPTVDKFIFIVIIGCGYPLLTAAWQSMKNPINHVFYVWLIGVCFFLIDLLIVIKHPLPKEQNRSRASLFWADAPMVVAFPVLMAYLWWHPDTENPEVFVSGVVACQLLMSNAVFIVMEFGLLGSPKEASAHG